MTYRGFGNSTSRYPKQMRIYRLEVLVETHAARVAIIFGIPADAIFSISNTWIVEDHISEFHWEKQTVKICHSNLIRHLCLHTQRRQYRVPQQVFNGITQRKNMPKNLLGHPASTPDCVYFQQEDFLSKKSGTSKTYFPIVLVAPAAGSTVPSKKEVAQLLFSFYFCPCSRQQQERKLGPVRSSFVVVRWSTFLTSSKSSTTGISPSLRSGLGTRLEGKQSGVDVWSRATL